MMLTEAGLFAVDVEILRGRKIQAIKVHRGLANCAIAESKEFVEKRASTLAARFLRMANEGDMEQIIIDLLRPSN